MEQKNDPFTAVPKNDLTCIWAAAVNHMVLIPTCTWFMKCSLGSREHLLVLRRLICLWPGRMNFLLGCGETVRLLASSRSWLDDCVHLWKSAILMRAGLGPRDRADIWFLSPKAPPLLTSKNHRSLELGETSTWGQNSSGKKNPQSVSKETKLKNGRGKVNSYISHQGCWPGYYSLPPLLWLNVMPGGF